MAADGFINMVGAAPVENFIPSFGKDAFVAHIFGPVGEFIVIR